MNPTVLVTGANGYTGYWFCKYLAEKGVKTRGMYYPPDGKPDLSNPNLELVPGDLLDRESIRQAVDGIEIVQNVAALYRPVDVSEKMYWAVNVDGVRNILEESSKAGVKRFVQCSTIGVHGTIANPPATEEAPIQPDDYYQLTKYEGEKLTHALAPELKMPYSIVRPAGIYGPRERRFLKLAKLIHRRRFVMFGTGEINYHFVHVYNLCDAFMLCAEKDEALGEVFIIGDEHATQLNDVVRIMAETLNMPVPKLKVPYGLLFSAAWMCEMMCKPLGIAPPLYRRRAHWFNSNRAFDIGKAKRLLGYEPKISSEDGLAEMTRSFRDAGWLA